MKDVTANVSETFTEDANDQRLHTATPTDDTFLPGRSLLNCYTST